MEDQPAGSSRVARRRDRRKAEIVKTATRILTESGYQGMSLEDVAEQTDIAKATLYHYFSSKDALVSAALETLTQEVLQRLAAREQALGNAGAREHLAAVIDEQIRILTETAPEVAAVFSWPRGWPAVFDEPMKDMRRRHDAVFRTVVQRGVDDGEFTCPDVNVALQCLHGILNQSSVWIGPGMHDDDRAELRAAIVDRALCLFY
ncbi:TetR family transcriptional regulator [Mycobacterium vulneris]|uniref:TetR/AcrR family transcriptional regulator n=2 Tax=Mycolicibacterium porcinum TaxID=39693 RepID=A0AAP7H6F6_9MYCO|nr:TetR/AcrR family transcriptional regulator [Mycolicibacterium porcinum]MBX8687119.1 TetR family transcriptional regulator [Mycobacterium sp. 20091114027_K0903767]OCB46498.1 TetR family transcriptional regulator [Mycolicibacterium vulneris]MCV7392106.1 TetR/AcrR family transcriptional regulator [Mycolicibacterium porcinum]OCB08853.1 TetR family transcriptional regulator [Mycolicibacterium porcinum]OCB51996.1 TetR family transcriptional regulator [Mycolicibacterium vulneris]